MDAIRKQLDVLMGANRNGDVTEVDRKYSDRDVCRRFLAGLCPHDLFQLTKMDLGPCPKVHSLVLRKDYEEAKAKGIHNYDRELEDLIERLIMDCERKIQRALKRLESEDAKAAVGISVSQVTQTPKMMELAKQINDKLKEVDAFDLIGETDRKIQAQEIVDELRVKRADEQAILLLAALDKDKASLLQSNNPPQLAPLPAPNPPDPQTQAIINEKLKRAEDLGEQGMIDEAQKVLEEAEALRKLSTRQEPTTDSSKFTAADVRIFVDGLSELRAQVEAMVLRANREDGLLLTCALRVSNPFGPGDESLVPFLVKGAKEGWAKFIIGNGKNSWDFTYIENVAHASICAELALRLRTPYVAGRPFFITNQKPMKFWDFLSNILEGLGYQRPSIHIPANVILGLAEIARFFQEKLFLCRTSNSFFTSSTLRSFIGTRTFDCSSAERVIGYSPVVSLEDGISLTIASFSQLANSSPGVDQLDLSKPSKAEKLLGNQSVSDLLLWRDDRKTFICLLTLFLLHYWFFLSERTMISSAAKLLMLFALVLFVHGALPSSMFGFSIEKIPLSFFEVPELTVKKFFNALASLWNLCICALGTLARGENWGFFLKVASSLYLFKLLLRFSLPTLSAAGLVCLFSFFIVYEQCEREIESSVSAGARGLQKMKRLLISKLPSSAVQYVS